MAQRAQGLGQRSGHITEAAGVSVGSFYYHFDSKEQLLAEAFAHYARKDVAEMVARGEVEIAVQQISELVPVKGADFVGPLPAEIQLYTTYSVAVGTGAKEPQAAVELVKFLTSPNAAPVIRSKALDPAM